MPIYEYSVIVQLTSGDVRCAGFTDMDGAKEYLRDKRAEAPSDWCVMRIIKGYEEEVLEEWRRDDRGVWRPVV